MPQDPPRPAPFRTDALLYDGDPAHRERDTVGRSGAGLALEHRRHSGTCIALEHPVMRHANTLGPC